jgi:hypothetical protein
MYYEVAAKELSQGDLDGKVRILLVAQASAVCTPFATTRALLLLWQDQGVTVAG